MPRIIELPETEAKGGRLSFIEGENIPFGVKRVFWIYDIQEETERGGHAHLNAEQVLVCLQGHVQVYLENTKGDKYSFSLSDPSKALYFPKQHWLKMSCDTGTILMVLASNEYNEEGYVRDYDDFKALEL
ncbi:FdtA/QdtA family cupin domain-containing protein [Fulvivirga sp. 29W222]|uniref:FdtA/QdtA family cupin domain-containing protein n=1 Tax=Fulvivirga marina TaxID=2494733 RepID=A0A937FYN3_9BACT|nr:FdtA/QdtA family cupin domain-containing protein [Fulvivirga marina]MBL6447222.1 FdtA/QdtA family cupin domain-containing protein [Fulvivirga marina]